MGITNLVDGTRSQQFTYDQLNRLLTAETTSTYATSPVHCWGESYVYDNSTTSPGEYGNLTNINAASTSYNGCTQESLSIMTSTLNNNQITGFSYDASGNVLNDTHNSYAWNAESEIKTAAGVNYIYDGDGNRVQKSNGKIYWYGAGSEVLDESDASGNITDEYVFFGGKRVAHRVVSGNVISYYGEDFLGTSRQIYTSASAALLRRRLLSLRWRAHPTPIPARRTTNSKAKNATPKPTTTTSAPATTPHPSAAGPRPIGPPSPHQSRTPTSLTRKP